MKARRWIWVVESLHPWGWSNQPTCYNSFAVRRGACGRRRSLVAAGFAPREVRIVKYVPERKR